MKFSDYQKRSYTALQEHESEKDRILNWTVGLAEEVGEILNLVKHQCWGGEDINKGELIKEIGDVLWYLSALASVFNIDLGEAALLNVKKLEKRFKTGNFSLEESKKRREAEEELEKEEEYKKIIKEALK